MSEWKEYRLGDLTDWYSGGTPSKKVDKYWNGDIPWISASSMHVSRYDNSDLKITDAGLRAGSRLVPEGTILLLVRGSTLHQRVPVGISTRPVAFNQDVKAIRIKEEVLKNDVIDAWFLLYWFIAKEKELLCLVDFTGIGAGKFDTAQLQNLIIEVPPEKERRKIVAVAKALDEKIELNRQINQTLEHIAQAIFKSWFVDFEPVKAKILAKQNGQDPERAAMCAISGKTDAEFDAFLEASTPEQRQQLVATATLFPDELEDADLGPTPKGWGAGPLSDICTQAIGGQWGSDEPTDGLVPAICMRGCDMEDIRDQGFAPDAPIRYIKQNALEKRAMSDQDLLIAASGAGPCGRPLWCSPSLSMAQYGVEVIYSNFVKRFNCKTTSHAVYIEQIVYGMYKNGTIGDYITGTSVPNLDAKGLLNGLSLVFPAQEILNLFAEYYKKIEAMRTSGENIILANIRDTFLPKLLSGEIAAGHSSTSAKDVA